MQQPPPAYDGKYQPPPHTVPVVTPVYKSLEFGPDPMQIVCPRCNQQVTTSIRTDTSVMQHLGAFCCCIFGLWLGCCLIPYCMDSLKEVTHTCPNCKNQLGIYKPSM